MCQSKADGGQRCFGHASDRFDRALAAQDKATSRVAASSSTKAKQAARAAEGRLLAAAEELASTEEGAARIRALAAQAHAAGDPEQAGRWDSAVRAGALLREKNAAVHAAATARKATARAAASAAEQEALRSAPLGTVRATRANVKVIAAQLDAQGFPPNHPLRGVLEYTHGSHLLIARDADGQIIGGIDASIATFRDRRDVHIVNMRVIPRRSGYGQRLIAEAARQTAGRGELTVGGAIEEAKPFYAKTGASFVPASSRGEWSPESVAAMKAGRTPPPGEVLSEEEFQRRERVRLREKYPDYYRDLYGDVEP